ncbi:DNA polymerase III subunit delta [Luteimonas vadosa]|uniref:DNA polymerase III subunit delta n=1 Tax=Luteimonas vadosa TaxID=1165507 RepID=A0ABP9E408_9GAMM
MKLTPEQLPRHLADTDLRPAYLIAGPEPLRVLEAADAVRAAARTRGIVDREVHEAQGNQRDVDWEAFAAALRAPGLFSARRLVEVRLPTGKPGKDGSREILAFCAEPPDDVCLLVTCHDWSKKHGGKWSDEMERIGAAVMAWAVKPHELAAWIEARLRSRGLQAEPEAVQRLAERVDGNLLAAAQEIDKLALLLDPDQAAASGKPSPLSAEAMESLVADAARFDVFRLVDAAMNGQGAMASRMLAGLRAEGTVLPALMGMVVMELQRAAALARVAARGGNLAAEFKAQRIWDSKQAVYRRALQRHEAARWDRFVAEAGRIDRSAKGRAPGDPWQQLERLLLAIAEKRACAMIGR